MYAMCDNKHKAFLILTTSFSLEFSTSGTTFSLKIKKKFLYSGLSWKYDWFIHWLGFYTALVVFQPYYGDWAIDMFGLSVLVSLTAPSEPTRFRKSGIWYFAREGRVILDTGQHLISHLTNWKVKNIQTGKI
jgi:hypothetical protein